MSPYDVLVTHVGDWWLIEVADLEVGTQSRRFAEVDYRARRLVADTLDIPISSVRLGSFRLELGELDLGVADLEAQGVPLAVASAALGIPRQHDRRLQRLEIPVTH